MMIEWPAMAQRVASPAPSLPVPPRIAMFTGGKAVRPAPGVGGLFEMGAVALATMVRSSAVLLSEEVAGGIAQEGLAAAAVVRRDDQAADDGGGDAVQLAHDGLGGGGQ